MVNVRVEWPTKPGHFQFVKANLRTSTRGNPYFTSDGPYGTPHAFTVQPNNDIMARPKGSKRGAWKKVGQRRESYHGTTYYLGPDDQLCDVERRDLNNPIAQQWKKEVEAERREHSERS